MTAGGAAGVAGAAGVVAVPPESAGASAAALVIPDEEHSIQPGTSAWATFGREDAR